MTRPVNHVARGVGHLHGEALQARIEADQQPGGFKGFAPDDDEPEDDETRSRRAGLPRLAFLDPARLLPWERRHAR